MTEAILHGIILAFGLIVPLGVQNVFVFNQGALQPTFMRALPVVVTAGICDTILIVAAVSGVSLLVLTFAWLENIIFSIGIVFLLYIGFVLWKSDAMSTKVDGQTIFNEEANYFCGICFFIEPSCDSRYDWRYWVKFTQLFGGCKNGIYADDNHRFMALVFRACYGRTLFW